MLIRELDLITDLCSCFDAKQKGERISFENACEG